MTFPGYGHNNIESEEHSLILLLKSLLEFLVYVHTGETHELSLSFEFPTQESNLPSKRNEQIEEPALLDLSTVTTEQLMVSLAFRWCWYCFQ